MRTRLLVAFCTALIAAPVAAQSAPTARTGTIVGTVARDSVGTMVGQAQVQLPQLNQTAATNWLGEFQFSNVPPGRYAITVRAVGFQPLLDSLDVAPGARVDADIILTTTPVNLAAQRTTASAVEKRLPPGLQEMQDRMKTHVGGFFVTDSMLRANNEKKLTEFFSKIPHLNLELSPKGAGVFLSNGREHGTGGPIFSAPKPDSLPQSFPHGRCYMNIFVDGATYFVGPASETNPPPDVSVLWARDYSGIEYYPGGATIPAEFNLPNTSCGALLLWTRRTP